jgi:ATP-dependent DNA helicase RecQ
MSQTDLFSVIDEATASLGYTCLKDEQKKALHSFVSGKDVFVSLPTGYGKSLCYALLPIVFNKIRGIAESRSIVMVVSPLIALMKDQSVSLQPLHLAWALTAKMFVM